MHLLPQKILCLRSDALYWATQEGQPGTTHCLQSFGCKLTQTPLVYSVSRFNLGGIGALFWGAKPTKTPRGDGTDANK